MPTTYGNDIVYCLKSHCGVRGYCRQKWVLQVQIICKFSNERTCKRNEDVQGLSCGFEVSYSEVFYEFLEIRIHSCEKFISLQTRIKSSLRHYKIKKEKETRSFPNRSPFIILIYAFYYSYLCFPFVISQLHSLLLLLCG